MAQLAGDRFGHLVGAARRPADQRYFIGRFHGPDQPDLMGHIDDVQPAEQRLVIPEQIDRQNVQLHSQPGGGPQAL